MLAAVVQCLEKQIVKLSRSGAYRTPQTRTAEQSRGTVLHQG